jgi:GGDEF domain-containing protein
MPLSVFSRRRPTTVDPQLSAAQRRDLPRHFEALGEALVAGRSPVAACAVVGGALAADGVSLGEALSSLGSTYAALGRGEPSFAAVEALSLAWSEETLAFLGDVSCEDPLTGLASAAHLRARIAEVCREAATGGGSVRTSHALVVVDLALDTGTNGHHDPFDQALRLAGAAELVRETFTGGETLARVGRGRLVVLVGRSTDLGTAVSQVRAALERARVATRPRLWIEGLPDEVDGALRVLAGLSLP